MAITGIRIKVIWPSRRVIATAFIQERDQFKDKNIANNIICYNSVLIYN